MLFDDPSALLHTLVVGFLAYVGLVVLVRVSGKRTLAKWNAFEPAGPRRAMAELGRGPHRSGDVADVLGRKVTSLAPTRAQLISKGMVWSPNHGDTAFTVPLFDEYMQRIMPGDAWRIA